MCNRKLIFLFLNQNICCGYSKEHSQWDDSFGHQKQLQKNMGNKYLQFYFQKFKPMIYIIYKAVNYWDILITENAYFKKIFFHTMTFLLSHITFFHWRNRVKLCLLRWLLWVHFKFSKTFNFVNKNIEFSSYNWIIRNILVKKNVWFCYKNSLSLLQLVLVLSLLSGIGIENLSWVIMFYWLYQMSWGKEIKCEACWAFYRFFATSSINSIIQEHEC